MVDKVVNLMFVCVYDIVVFGVIGFIGKLIVEYLVQLKEVGKFKIVIVGCNVLKLEVCK